MLKLRKKTNTRCLITQVHTLRSATCAKATRSRAFGNAVPRSAKRNLRDGRRSRAFDNAGPRSACAPCAMDVVSWTQHPLEGRTRRRSVNRQIRRGAVVSRDHSLIVRDPRRSRLRRSTRSTISSALRARATSSALTCA